MIKIVSEAEGRTVAHARAAAYNHVCQALGYPPEGDFMWDEITLDKVENMTVSDREPDGSVTRVTQPYVYREQEL